MIVVGNIEPAKYEKSPIKTLAAFSYNCALHTTW